MLFQFPNQVRRVVGKPIPHGVVAFKFQGSAAPDNLIDKRLNDAHRAPSILPLRGVDSFWLVVFSGEFSASTSGPHSFHALRCGVSIRPVRRSQLSASRRERISGAKNPTAGKVETLCRLLLELARLMPLPIGQRLTQPSSGLPWPLLIACCIRVCLFDSESYFAFHSQGRERI